MTFHQITLYRQSAVDPDITQLYKYNIHVVIKFEIIIVQFCHKLTPEKQIAVLHQYMGNQKTVSSVHDNIIRLEFINELLIPAHSKVVLTTDRKSIVT